MLVAIKLDHHRKAEKGVLGPVLRYTTHGAVTPGVECVVRPPDGKGGKR